MTTPLFRQDAYRTEAAGIVVAHTPEGGIVLDQTLFYPTGGGQPGDCGRLIWQGRSLSIATAVKAEGDQIALVVAEPVPLPPIGAALRQAIDWPCGTV
jgi:misacylated tRNA(Ala) deacylase